VKLTAVSFGEILVGVRVGAGVGTENMEVDCVGADVGYSVKLTALSFGGMLVGAVAVAVGAGVGTGENDVFGVLGTGSNGGSSVGNGVGTADDSLPGIGVEEF
jgi:hypothetical protein